QSEFSAFEDEDIPAMEVAVENSVLHHGLEEGASSYFVQMSKIVSLRLHRFDVFQRDSVESLESQDAFRRVCHVDFRNPDFFELLQILRNLPDIIRFDHEVEFEAKRTKEL